MLYVPSGSLESTMLGTSFLKFLKLYLFGMYMYKVHVHVLFHTISVSATVLFSVETVHVHVLSKQIQFQKFQERCAQHGAFQRLGT